MKHRVLLSAAAALIFAVQTNLAVLADDYSAETETSEQAPTLVPEETASFGSTELAYTGQVKVSIAPALDMAGEVEFTAELAGERKTITLNDSAGEAVFSGLASGRYTLKVTGSGFADHVQTVDVGSQAVNVKLMTGFAEGIDYQRGPHPGALLIGDVNNDGVIDDSDRQALTDAVDGGGVSDLNGDGVTDLVDLEYLAKGYNVEGAHSVSETVIPSTVISPSAGEGTLTEGSLDSLFVKEGSVKLYAMDGVISDDNPVSLEFEMIDDAASQADGIVISVAEDNPVAKAEVDIVYVDGDGVLATQTALIENGVHHLLDTEEVTVDVDRRGNIHINLGSQIAVKKVTFKIFGMTKDSALAEISSVEFVNGMESRIPEPDTDIPEGLFANTGDKRFVLGWEPCVNVTGYEVELSVNGRTELQKVTGSSLSVSTFGGKELVNGTTYSVRARSVNGAWRSGWSETVNATPRAAKKPDKPDGLTVSGGYRSFKASWKKTEDAERYNLYYKKVGESEYTKIADITAVGFTVSDLEDKTEYTLYVTALNEYGESAPSLSAIVRTTDIDPPVMPKFNLINTGEKGQKGAHIADARHNYGDMVDSLDEDGSAWGTVDHDAASYYYRASWDDGGYNYIGDNGLFYEFDKAYDMDRIALYESVPGSPEIYYASINCWDEDGNKTEFRRIGVSKKYDGEGRKYFQINLPKITAKRIQIALANYSASGRINVAEVYFYHYDTISDDIMALYSDDLHLVLKSGVTQSDIDALRKRINTPDPVCGELNPDRELLERELKNAEDILNCKNLNAPVYIHNSITTNDVNRGFGGLNAWQPVGVTAAAGDTVTVYVGHNTKKTGANTNLQLVATQYHAESGSLAKTVCTLKVGANVIDIPKIWSIDKESGGALYVQYTGSSANDRYAVRVSGGVKVPILDLYGVSDEAEKLNRTNAYMTELADHCAKLESLHAEYHEASSNGNVNRYGYEEQNCILGASDILLDNMLLSLPAQRILAAGTASKAVASLDAVEEMMNLFYQHKGLNKNASEEINRFPKGHLNIRYQRMFANAFMYAAGNHIGIEWGSCSGMLSSSSVQSDEDGRYISGSYFGWGIAHEIGHCINQGCYAVPEITNNYFAQLAQAKDTNAGMRFTYKNIYDKVTSRTAGSSSNLATQLGMYWQLRAAYDEEYNYKTFDDRGEQLDSLFYARVDSYARTPSSAPAPEGIALTLSGGGDQCLMRLACAAAEKDILEFFERWGKIPDSDTVRYASQFPKEERAIYYADDDSRIYRMNNYYGTLGTDGDVEAAIASASANGYEVNFTLNADIPEDEVLGYEIVRRTTSGGRVHSEAVGFTTGNRFTDYAAGLNNRVVTYEIYVVDKYLYRSAPLTLEPIKITDDGSLDKSNWTAATLGVTADGIETAGDDNDPCNSKPDEPALLAIDGDSNTVFTGTAVSGAKILFELNRQETVSGFKYISESAVSYTLMVRENGTWHNAAGGTLDGSGTVWFENADGKYVSTYKTDAAMLVINSAAELAIAEFDLLGVTGDNVDFKRDGAVGILAEDYEYASGEIIPEGSLVFTGSYKGNPAYNVVMLFDENGYVVGSASEDGSINASQIILADKPTGLIRNVSEGTWIYWVDASAADSFTSVRAELYRVNNALTNEGERLVSDSLFIEIPYDIPYITFGND
ncbi:MAG: hypothetical protein HDT43_11055 [Ruminococcaceae bacterium]|nr:hypothetical protein [Oscillospiraceae bacterium]